MSSTADSTSGFGETSRLVMFKFLAVVASKGFRVVCTYREGSHTPRSIRSGRSPMKEQSIALVSCPSLFRRRSTCIIFSCFASSEAGMENGKPATTALISLFSRLSSVRFSSLVVLRV